MKKHFMTTYIKNTQILLLLMMITALSSCAVYRSSFSCGDAKGANCVSMEGVDKMITSGEIERFNDMRNKRNTRTKTYKADKLDENISPIANKE